jgi:hypothetical protein
MVNLDLATLVAIFPSRIVELFGHYILDEVAIGLKFLFSIRNLQGCMMHASLVIIAIVGVIGHEICDNKFTLEDL